MKIEQIINDGLNDKRTKSEKQQGEIARESITS